MRVLTVEYPVIDYRPVPRVLTDPLAEPAPPPAQCRVGGAPAVCALDGLATIPAWRGVVQQCNADRARAALLGGGDGAQ